VCFLGRRDGVSGTCRRRRTSAPGFNFSKGRGEGEVVMKMIVAMVMCGVANFRECCSSTSIPHGVLIPQVICVCQR
jgi:hypothetical protein